MSVTCGQSFCQPCDYAIMRPMEPTSWKATTRQSGRSNHATHNRVVRRASPHLASSFRGRNMQMISELFTVKEFCAHIKIGRRTFYDLQARGEAPRLIRIGRRTLIARDTAREWLREREGIERVAKVKPPKLDPPDCTVSSPPASERTELGQIRQSPSASGSLTQRLKKPW